VDVTHENKPARMSRLGANAAEVERSRHAAIPDTTVGVATVSRYAFHGSDDRISNNLFRFK